MYNKENKFKIIWFFIRQYKPQIAALSFLSLLVGGLEAVSVASIYPILNSTFDKSTESKNIVLSFFRSLAESLPINDPFIAYCFIFIFIAFLAFIVKCICINYRLKFSAWLVQTKQDEIFNRYMKADYQFFTDNKQGKLIYDIGRAPQGLSDLIISATSLMSEAALSISVFFILIVLSWKVTIAVIFLGIVYLYSIRYIARKISYSSGKGELEAITKANIILNEVISGIQQIKVFATAGYWKKEFRDSIKKRWYHFTRRSKALEFPSAVLMVALYFFMGISVMITRVLFPDNFVRLIPIFGTFMFAIFRLVPIAAKISGLTMTIMSSLPDCELCYYIFATDINLIKDGEEELVSFKSEIKFDKVSFAYAGGKEVLKDFSVSFKKGKTTAIVGRSGSGKTTIVNLIIRLFEADRGMIKIDNIDIKVYKTESLMRHIGFVSQDAFALNDTVRKNITFGLDYSNEEVIRAAKYADAHSFIVELPDGYSTFVGDRGVRLSGGQKQRIAVARAMVRKPKILIFDEATNALDNISQLSVQKAIEEISKDHTVIIIAHRLSTICNADNIIVLENGSIIEEGTYEELIKKRGSYWELYQSQSGERYFMEKDKEPLGDVKT